MIRVFASALCARVSIAGISILLVYQLSQKTSPDSLGQYFYAQVFISYLAAMALFGSNTKILQILSTENRKLVNKVSKYFYLSCILTVLIVAISLIYINLFVMSEDDWFYSIMVSSVILNVFSSLLSVILHAKKRFNFSLYFTGGISNLLFLGSVYFNPNEFIELNILVIYYILSLVVSFFLLLFFVWRDLPTILIYKGLPNWAEIKELFNYAAPVFVGQGYSQLGVLFLGIAGDLKGAGILGSLQKLALSLGMLLQVSNRIVAPDFSKYYSYGSINELNKLYKKHQRLTMFLVVSVFIIGSYISLNYLHIFNESYIDYALALVGLLFSQVLYSIPGNANVLFHMSNKPLTVFVANTYSVLVMLILLIFFYFSTINIWYAVVAQIAAYATFSIFISIRVREFFHQN